MQITGHPVTEGYIVSGVKFDTYANGVLIDAKGYYSQFIENGQWRSWFNGESSIIDQAVNQVRVAHGTPIRWVFAEPETAALVKRTFAGIDELSTIEIVVVPPK
ncbi:hypothetical protein BST12_13575 [Mycobacterium angelicum]|uniref:Tox-REase-5 domain-containing protein n=2 Tax=Mycobacterium angelicum TaxID=470074 RepID=A0A1W9ZTK8_MYCAN|nr:hypothetical protein BST12_13575 [Mycobacterium angelicum]